MELEETSGNPLDCGHGYLQPRLIAQGEGMSKVPYSNCWIGSGGYLKMHKRPGERTRFMNLGEQEYPMGEGAISVKPFDKDLRAAWQEWRMLDTARGYGIDCASPVSLVTRFSKIQLLKLNEGPETLSDLLPGPFDSVHASKDFTDKLSAASQRLYADMGTLANHGMVQTSFTKLSHTDKKRWKYFGQESGAIDIMHDKDLSHMNISKDGAIRDFEHVQKFSSKRDMMIPLATSLMEASLTVAYVGIRSGVSIVDNVDMIRSGFRKCLQNHKGRTSTVGTKRGYYNFVEGVNCLTRIHVKPMTFIENIEHYLRLAGWSSQAQAEIIKNALNPSASSNSD